MRGKKSVCLKNLVILTAAHCFGRVDPFNKKVTYYNPAEIYYQFRKGYPNYDESSTCGFDIACLMLDEDTAEWIKKNPDRLKFCNWEKISVN